MHDAFTDAAIGGTTISEKELKANLEKEKLNEAAEAPAVVQGMSVHAKA